MNEQQSRENSLKSKIFYGFADIYGGGAFVVISTFFIVFLTNAQRMPAALAGTIPLIGKIWDAVTDPMMGNIADRTKSRFGAKRFWILIGSLVSAITFFVMWIPFSSGGSTAGQYVFYVLMYCLFSTGFTIVMVPYNALLPDMVDDYTVRAKFSSVRMAFSAFGAIIAGLIPTILIKDNTNAGQYTTVAAIFAVIFLVVILLTFFGTWEKQKEVQHISMKETFTQSFTVYKSRAFKLFIAIFVFGQMGSDFMQGLAVYYVSDVLNAYGGGNFTVLMGVILVSQFLGMLLFGPIMAKTSKKFPILIGSPVRLAATLAMLLFSHEGAPFYMILALSFIIGLGMAGTSTTIYAILADMADVDELITTINRPGTCSGMATFIRKISAGLSSALIGLSLTIVGFDEGIANSGMRQSAGTQKGIAYIYVFSQVLFLVLTYWFTLRFPMKKKEFEIIKREIKRRKGEADFEPTRDEIKICEKVTGFGFDELWNRDNALNMK